MRNGNRHTALRWAAFLRAAGHAVEVSVQWSPLQSSRHGAADAMLALHARRSYPSIKAFPSDRPLVVALTGTDVYRDTRESAEARESLELAHRLIVLQPMAARELAPRLRQKVRVVVQSSSTPPRHAPVGRGFRGRGKGSRGPRSRPSLPPERKPSRSPPGGRPSTSHWAENPKPPWRASRAT